MATTTRIGQSQIERALFALKFGTMMLGDKVVLLVAMLLNFSLFAWAIYEPDLTRLATAGLFSITTCLPILHYHYRKKPTVEVVRGETEEQAA